MRKSPTECRSSGGTGRKSLECCSSENERERDQGEGVQNSGKTGTGEQGKDICVLKKAQEKKSEVAEMRMLRWVCGVTKLDKIRNERIKGTTKVGGITKHFQEWRLAWCGHVMRREEHYVGRRAMEMKVQEKEDLREDGWAK